jgi:hypothetical protein
MANYTKEERARLLAEREGAGMTTMPLPEQKNTETPSKKPTGKATGVGLLDYDLCLIRVSMGTRINAADREEGTATAVNIISKIRTTKLTPQNVELQNKHTGGCILSAPGNPNECTWFFPSGTVETGKTYRAETIKHRPSAAAPAITAWNELKIYTNEN